MFFLGNMELARQQISRQAVLGTSLISKSDGSNAQSRGILNIVPAEHILSIMRTNFREKGIRWVPHFQWVGPTHVGHEDVDYSAERMWAADHEMGHVRQFISAIQNREQHLHPPILIKRINEDKFVISDGHHRSLAYKELNRPIPAYVGFLSEDSDKYWGQAIRAHDFQIHSGSDSRNK